MLYLLYHTQDCYKPDFVVFHYIEVCYKPDSYFLFTYLHVLYFSLCLPSGLNIVITACWLKHLVTCLGFKPRCHQEARCIKCLLLSEEPLGDYHNTVESRKPKRTPSVALYRKPSQITIWAPVWLQVWQLCAFYHLGLILVARNPVNIAWPRPHRRWYAVRNSGLHTEVFACLTSEAFWRAFSP